MTAWSLKLRSRRTLCAVPGPLTPPSSTSRTGYRVLIRTCARNVLVFLGQRQLPPPPQDLVSAGSSTFRPLTRTLRSFSCPHGLPCISLARPLTPLCDLDLHRIVAALATRASKSPLFLVTAALRGSESPLRYHDKVVTVRMTFFYSAKVHASNTVLRF